MKYIKPILIIEDLYIQTYQEHQDELSQQVAQFSFYSLMFSKVKNIISSKKVKMTFYFEFCAYMYACVQV